jgi:hypothetical protein
LLGCHFLLNGIDTIWSKVSSDLSLWRFSFTSLD